MKIIERFKTIFLLFFLAGLCACQAPTHQEFNAGALSFYTSYRVPVKYFFHEYEAEHVQMAYDSTGIIQVNGPAFSEWLLAVVNKVNSDEVALYSSETPGAEKLGLEKINTAESWDTMRKFLSDRGDDNLIEGLTKGFEAIFLCENKNGKTTLEPAFIRLIFTDPAGILPEKNFGHVKVDDLKNIPFSAGSSIKEYLGNMEYERTVFSQWVKGAQLGIRTYEDSRIIREQLEAGNIDSLRSRIESSVLI